MMKDKIRKVITVLAAAVLAISCSVTVSMASSAENLKHIQQNPEREKLSAAGLEDEDRVLALSGDMASSVSIKKLEGISQDNQKSGMIFSKERNGIYFIQYEDYAYKILFYDLKTGTLSTEGSYASQDAVYADEKVICMVDETHKKNDSDAYDYTIHLTKIDPATGEITESDMDSFVLDSSWYNLISACGMDNEGRLYVATNEKNLYLFSAEGDLLEQKEYANGIHRFFGFDSTNGNFYYEGSYNWEYWGYDHDMASLMAGNISSKNEISLPENNLCMLYQNYFYDHKESVRFLDDKYLAVLSTLNSNQLAVMDSSKYSVDDYTKQTMTIYAGDNSLGLSLLNIANTDAVKTQLYTSASRYVDDLDNSSEGPRCALMEDKSALLVKTESNTLTEYNLSDASKKIEAQTQHEVYDFAVMDGDLVAVERDDDDFYVETIDWTYPDDFEVKAPSSVKVGESGEVVCSAEDPFTLDFEYNSSDPDVISADERGRICAWSAGKADIIVKAPVLGLEKKVTVTAEDSELSESAFSVSYTDSEGTVSNNIHYPLTSGYSGSALASALVSEGNDFTRVEYVNNRVVAETYDKSFKLKETKKITPELNLYGGFFNGSDAYYIAYGQFNKYESDDVEVFRFVKYDKNWNRVGACSVKGANTYTPFDAGGLSMCEYNGVLYIHTCHEMYASSDGLHHQANCTFKVDESDMSLIDSYTGVMNLSEGYVSHSFEQKAAADENMLYRADLGDAYPRGIALTATKHDKKVSEPSFYGRVVSIPGDIGRNYTGFALGGLGLSDDNYIIAGCGIAEENDRTRNVFISSSFKDKWTSNTTWLTNYEEGSAVNVETPKLVKLNSNQFLLMWEEKNTDDASYTTKMVQIASDGSQVSEIRSLPLSLSGCEPVTDKSGNVVWYYTENSTPKFVRLNPFRIDAAEKDALEIKEISLCAVSLSQKYYTYSGQAQTPSVTVTRLGDTLTEGKDYKIEYKNNTEPGTGTVIVTGIGEYSGTVSKTFSISKARQYITGSVSAYTIEVGGTAVITASAKENAKITFGSSDESIATVDADGTIHALSEGSVTITLRSEETAHYAEGYVSATIKTSKDVHTMVECSVVYADEKNNKATVTRKCSVCGKEETVSFTTLDRLGTLYFWSGWTGRCYISYEQTKGNEYSVSISDYTPSDAENTELELVSSNTDIMTVNGAGFKFVGTGKVTLTIRAKYRPSVRESRTFEVFNEGEGTGSDDPADADDPWGSYGSDDPCASGHSYGNWKITKAATEISKGEKTRTCSECGSTETVSIAALAPTLKAVKISKPKAAKKSAIIKWKKLSKKNLKKIKKVEIQYSLDKSFKSGVKTKYAKAKKTSYKIKGLKKGKKYYVRIRAYTKSGSTVHVSKWSKVKKVKAR